MRHDLARLLTLIAASGMTPKQIRSALFDLARSKPEAMMDAVRHLRNSLNHVSENVSYNFFVALGRRPLVDDTSAQRAERMIREEIKLSAREIEKFFKMKAKVYGYDPNKIPALRPKEGIANWLRRVEKAIGGSRLLQLVSGLSGNENDHEKVDWPLKK